MKAIVAEIDKKHMIVITDKGDFLKTKRILSAGIGDEIELKPQKMSKVYRRFAAMAAGLLVCAFLTTGVYAYYTPYSYVSVDINPSIGLTLNRFERVISVKPLSDETVNFIENTKGIKNQVVDDALAAIIKSASEKGYIDGKSQNQVVVVVSTKNPEQENKIINEVSAAASGELAKVSGDYAVMVEKTTVSDYQEAMANKVSPGREILASKLKELMPELKDEDIRNMTVKETMKLIKEGRKALTAEQKDDKKNEKPDKKDANNGKDSGEDKGKGKINAAVQDKGKNNSSGKVKGNENAAVKKADDSKLKGNNGRENGKKAADGDEDNKDDKKNDDKSEDHKDTEIKNNGTAPANDSNDKGAGQEHKDGSNSKENGNGGKQDNKDDRSGKDNGNGNGKDK
ncbi:MAG: anti-sigma factor domain-containing protein [Caulobacteraceae bacterium]